MKNSTKIILVLSTVLLLVSALSVNILAVDTSQDGSITIDYTYNNNPLDDVHFRVYQVAKLGEDGLYALTSDFQDFELDFYQLEYTSYWIEAKNSLENYIDYQMLTPTHEFLTDDAGNYDLDDLQLGLYYIVADFADDGFYYYYSEPIMIFVGQFDEDENKWLYEFIIRPKVSIISLDEFPASLTVNKTWENIDCALLKPDSIEVQLYCNGTVVDTVILNEANLWSYTWYGIDTDQVWAVREKTQLSDFEVSYDRDCFTFEIINTYIGQTDDEIPQTGSTIYLAAILASAGVVLILLGSLISQRGKYYE